MSWPKTGLVGDALLLIVAALGCAAPTAWVSFPAAVALLLWLPGRLLVKALPPINTLAGGAWMGLAASFVLTPIPLAWLWRFPNSRPAVLAVLVALNALLLLLAWRWRTQQRPLALFSSNFQRGCFGLLLLFVGGCVFGSFWLPGAFGRVGTPAAHDYVKHHAVLWSLEHYPLPLRNVFYAGEDETPYYYYQYHHHVAAALRKLTGDSVSIPFGFGASSALLAMVFVALVFMLARGLSENASWGAGLLAAACVSVIGGWDVIPVAVRVLLGANPPVVLDSWCPVPWRMHNVMTQFQWCPQHMAAGVALMLAAVWLRRAPLAGWWVLLAPLLAASVFGSSVYLAMTFFLAAAVYVLLELWSVWREPARRRGLVLATAGMIALGAALMGVQAWEYVQLNARISGGLVLTWDRFDLAVLGRLLPPGPLANYLDVPWLVLLDFGLPALALLLITRATWARLWRDPAARLLLIAGVLGTIAMFTVRSAHSPFDYSFRVAVLPLQIVAACCAGLLLIPACVRPAVGHWRRPIIVLATLPGLAVGLYEAPLMAARGVLQRPADQSDAGALAFIRQRTPPDAIVQGDPLDSVTLPEKVDRRVGVADPDNSHVRVFYPLDAERMRSVLAAIQSAFVTTSARQAYDFLRAAHVGFVLVGAHERKRYGELPQFDDSAWFEPVYVDEHARVYSLRSPVLMGPPPPDARR